MSVLQRHVQAVQKAWNQIDYIRVDFLFKVRLCCALDRLRCFFLLRMGFLILENVFIRVFRFFRVGRHCIFLFARSLLRFILRSFRLFWGYFVRLRAFALPPI